MFLVDSNGFVEILLRQQQAEETMRFLNNAPRSDLFLTEFSLYSIGIILLRRKLHDTLVSFVNDMVIDAGIGVIRLETRDMEDVCRTTRSLGLDFDDAYQYVAAEKHGLTLVSFDSDFDKTERGRNTPQEILASA